MGYDRVDCSRVDGTWRRGSMHACRVAVRNAPNASPPSLMSKMVEKDGELETGRKNCLTAVNSFFAVFTNIS